MKIAIGTKSERKISVLRTVLKNLLPNIMFEIVPYAASSSVNTTPIGDETLIGARNRAIETRNNIKNADYYIGLESGLVERHGDVFEEAWCCVLMGKKEFTSYSSGLKVPEEIIGRMKKNDRKHWEVMLDLNEERGESDDGDTWGTYSGKSLSRDISLEEALRNSLIQIFKSEKSLF